MVAGKSTTDGPFAEAKEVVGGYILIEAASLDEATAIAEQCPNLPYGMVVEVRPIGQACHLARSLGWATMRGPAETSRPDGRQVWTADPPAHLVGGARRAGVGERRARDGRAGGPPPRTRACGQICGPLTIQGTPKRSTSMPNRSAQNDFSSGMVIWPPSASALKMRSASSTLSTWTLAQKPAGLT